jgi:hypothetical protein
VAVWFISTAADVAGRAGTASIQPLLDRFAVAGIEEGQLLLEADRIDIGQVIAEHFELLALRVRTGGREVQTVIHRAELPFRLPPLAIGVPQAADRPALHCASGDKCRRVKRLRSG